MLEALTLPEGLVLVRTTDAFTADTAPAGLLSAHRLAREVWGRLQVEQGTMRFVLEDTGEARRLGVGDTQVITPTVAHHVEPDPDARFTIEFHRPAVNEPATDP